MNEKFNNFTIINNDSTLSKTYVTAYVSDRILTSNDTPDKKGKLVIVDNTDENNPIIDLISKYGLFIDDVFIAGGYGFKTYNDAKKILDTVNGFNTLYENIIDSIDALNNKKFIIEIGEQTTDDTDQEPKYLDIQKNKYGYITSYKYLDVDKIETTNIISNVNGEELSETIIKYVISVKEKSDINYVKDIQISKEYDYVEIIEGFSTGPFNLKCDIYSNIVDDSSDNSHNIKYNNDLEIYLKSSTTSDINNNLLNPLNGFNSKVYKSKSLTFEKPVLSYEDDLILYIIDKNDNIVYQEEFKGLLKWKDKYAFTSNSDEEYNNYNFRDTNVDANLSSSTVFTSLIPAFYNDNINKHLINYNEDIYLEFQNNRQCYDYLILRNDYNIEFYYNGIKSNNWVVKKIGDYYIWQSPQKYKGSHTWKIIIK